MGKTLVVGRMYISVIPDELKSPELSKEMEQKLQQISEGNLTKSEILEDVLQEFRDNLKNGIYKKKSFERCLKVKKASRKNYKRKGARYFE